MKKFNRVLVVLAGVLVAMAPIITTTASACAVSFGESEIPDCLK